MAMLFQRLFDARLAQASYLLGCTRTKQALVVDPNRDLAQYERAAAAEGLRITHVTETHIHADFVSGSRELARRTGAQLLLSDEGGEGWRYAFAAEAGATLLKDGATFLVGDLRIDAVHTPGHTPEHLMFLVADTTVSPEPVGALTGDFVFVGDVGRPDLLERAAQQVGTMEAGARQLFRSLRRLDALPDWLQLWPGHGAGSACGKALGALPQTTLGWERRSNWALLETDEARFVEAVLAGQPAPPTYFARMKAINRDGPPPAPSLAMPREASLDEVAAALARGDTVLDLRPTAEYARGHLPGSLSIPLNKSFTTWAGWLVVPDRALWLVGDAAAAQAAARELALIGVDTVMAALPVAALDAWQARGGELARMPQTTPAELAARLGDGVFVVDVRNASEYAAGHLPGVPNIPLGELPQRVGEIPRDRPVVVHCQGGGRSAIAASVLEGQGIPNAVNLEGGYGRWALEGHPVERPAAD
ncbi:MAG TPA: rhodanese-like domain-containing protein [Gemmatimonadales bacterium]|nr:rhodanese-like domain-containing protein [Gemmatimonadales bacterium]